MRWHHCFAVMFLILAIVALSPVALRTTQGIAQAQNADSDLVPSQRGPWNIITTSCEYQHVILFNAMTAESYHLVTSDNGLVEWREIALRRSPSTWRATRHEPQLPPHARLIRAIAAASTTHTAEGTISIHLKDSYRDAGHGLQPGDVITHVNGERLADFGEFMEKLTRAMTSGAAKVTVIRAGESLIVEIAAEE
jgi:hypothetical protein